MSLNHRAQLRLLIRNAVSEGFRDKLKDNQLTVEMYDTMQACGDGFPNLNEVSEETGILGPSLSRIINKLNGFGLIEIRFNPHDKRHKILRLTNKGKCLLKRMQKWEEKLS